MLENDLAIYYIDIVLANKVKLNKSGGKTWLEK